MLSDAQLVEYRRLLADSAISRKQMNRADREEGYPFERGFNEGLAHATMLLANAIAYDPTTGEHRSWATYPDPFGPHRISLVTDDGGWTTATREDVPNVGP